MAKQGSYSDALNIYFDAAAAMTGVKLPLTGAFRTKAYMDLEPGWESSDLMACINGVAECMMKQKNYDGVRALRSSINDIPEFPDRPSHGSENWTEL